MNRFERFIYDRVRYNPRLKRTIVDTYQRIFSVIPIKKFESQYPVKVREGFFYGFHDKCPWSPDNTKLLAHQFDDPLHMPLAQEHVTIGYFSGGDFMEFRPIGKTCAWNWQMGSMLQWVGNSSNIIFNDFDGEKHISKIVELDGLLIKELPRPIAAMSPDGKLALSYSFVRLRKYAPAYGYANGKDPEEDILVPKNDGLFILDIQSGESNRLFSLNEIANLEPEPSMKNAYHYFTHCLFSPTGERFVFFHRWVLDNGQTWTRMLSCDVSGEDLFIFPTSGTVTHISWKNADSILAYAFIKGMGDHYYLFKDKTDQFTILGKDHFSSDGHPQFFTDGKRMVSDTYPDRFRRQYLFIYDVEKDERNDIATIRSPMKYRHDLRCDLHPRWNRNGTMVCFDSAHTGSRALCTIRV